MTDSDVILKPMDGHSIGLIKCEIRNGKLVRRGPAHQLTLKEATIKFAPSADPRARANVLRARRGQYLGMRTAGKVARNFLIINPADDGDIRWLLDKNPELEASIIEIFLVDDVTIGRTATDLPSAPSGV